MSARVETGAPATPKEVRTFTIDDARAQAAKLASAWLNNDEGIRDATTLLEWRDDCRDDLFLIRAKSPVIAEWSKVFDDATLHLNVAQVELSLVRSIVNNGQADIETAIHTLRDLLRLAIEEVESSRIPANRGGSLIRAAGRYVDDIERQAQMMGNWTFPQGAAA